MPLASPHQGKNLAGHNFRFADLRGADFSHADLTGADFSNARTGLSQRSSLFLGAIALFLAVLTGFFPFQIGPMEVVALQDNQFTAIVASVIIFAALPGLSAIAIWKGLGFAARKALLAFIITFITPVFLGWIGVVRDLTLTGGGLVGLIVGAVAAGLLLAGVGVFAIAIVIAGLVSIGWAYVVTAVGGLFILAAIAGGIGFISAFLADPRALLSANEVARQAVENSQSLSQSVSAPIRAVAGSEIFAGLAIIAGAVLVAGLGCTLGWRILQGDERYSALKFAAVRFCSSHGTCFQHANLTDANFTQAQIKNANFADARLIRTRWYQAQGLAFAYLNQTELRTPQIRELVTTGQGEGKNFDRQDFSNLDLQNANLKNAYLVNADLSRSNLQYANLSGAILVRSQLDGTNLNAVELTEACIDGWSVTSTTKIQDIQCRSIFLRWENEVKQDEFPYGRKFQSNEFVEFLQTLQNTINLRHPEAFNPRAAVLTLAQLSEQYGEPLEILAIHQQEKDAVIKIRKPQRIEAKQLEADYSRQYSVVLQQNPEQVSGLETQIRYIMDLLKQGKHRPIITIENNKGIVITGGSTTISVDNFQVTDVKCSIDAISASYLYTNNYKHVLSKLYEAIVDEDHLTVEDKQYALEHLSILADTWVKKQNRSAIQTAQNSIYALQGLAQEVPQANRLNQACQHLLTPLKTLLNSGMANE